MSDNQGAWVVCSCGSHAVQVSRWRNEEIYMSFWSHGFDADHRADFWHRLKCAWKVLRTGTCQEHEVVLDSAESLKLSEIMKAIAIDDPSMV